MRTVDVSMRAKMSSLLQYKQVQQREQVTVLHTTQNVEEAKLLGSIQNRFIDGRIENEVS